MKLLPILESLPEIFDLIPPNESTFKKGFGLRVLGHIYFGSYEYSVSVQASEFHYCTPRETVPLNDYTNFEVMLNVPYEDIPSEWEDFNYCGDNVYAYVPIEPIERLLNLLDSKYKMVGRS